MQICLVAVLVGLGLSASVVHAEVTFEAFYRIQRGKQHTGFALQQLSRLGDRRTLITYAQTTRDGETSVETTRSVVDKYGRPISSEYRDQKLGQLGRITSRLAANQMRVETYADKLRTNTSTLKRPRLFGGFLFFTADLPKLGPDTTYRYRAFSEERGRDATGTLHVRGTRTVRDLKLVHVVDDYLGQPIENLLSEGGQPLASRSTTDDVTIFWVATKDEAVGEYALPEGELKRLFGAVPTGRRNDFVRYEGLRADDILRDVAPAKIRRIASKDALDKVPALPERGL